MPKIDIDDFDLVRLEAIQFARQQVATGQAKKVLIEKNSVSLLTEQGWDSLWTIEDTLPQNPEQYH